MNKRELMGKFIREVQAQSMLTLLLKNVFGYDNLNDYNYIFRMNEDDNCILIDIYDNVSKNRFNRYIFSFEYGGYDIKVVKKCSVFITYIFVMNVEDSLNNLIKFANLFRIDDRNMIEYGFTFLDRELVLVLDKIKNKLI